MNEESMRMVLLGVIAALAVIGLLALLSPEKSVSPSQTDLPVTVSPQIEERNNPPEVAIPTPLENANENSNSIIEPVNSERPVTETPVFHQNEVQDIQTIEECRLKAYETLNQDLKENKIPCHPRDIQTSAELYINEHCPRYSGDEIILSRLSIALHRACLNRL